MTLGDFRILGIREARNLARKLLIAGLEAATEARAQKLKHAEAVTFGQLIEQYIREWSQPRKASTYEDSRRCKKFFGHWSDTPVQLVTRSDVQELFDRIGSKSWAEANNVRRLLSSMFSFAMRRDLISENPVAAVKPNKERVRKRTLSEVEATRLIDAINSFPNIFYRTLFMLYLHLGTRKTELVSIKWSDIDFSGERLALRKTKNKEVNFRPLPPAVLKLFNELPREVGGEWVFPSIIPGRHLTNPDRAWVAVRKTAKLEDVTLHDLRRTLATWAAARGEQTRTISELLNHASEQTTNKHYIHTEGEGVRELLERHSEILERLGS